jgi:hypothetical protein
MTRLLCGSSSSSVILSEIGNDLLFIADENDHGPNRPRLKFHSCQISSPKNGLETI